ncbi:hypothetical protein VPH35_126531 [Triticum aestivum]
MDARAGTLLTPSSGRDPSTAAAANPSTGGIGLASAGAPPTISLARGLFMPPRMTSVAGGVAPAPPRAAPSPPSKLPNAARPKKGKASAKKNKAADGSDNSKARRKKLAGCGTGAAATEAPASSLVEPAADAHNVFDEMPPSLNDDAYRSTMGVGSNNSHWSQTNDMHFEDHEFEVEEEGEGIVDVPKGRAGNYTNTDDILLCNTWLQVSRDPSIGGDQSRDAYWGRMKEHYDVHNVSGIDHSERSLRSRWSTINSDCQKWVACQKAVDKLNPSGTNEDDRYHIARNLFKEEERKTKKGKIKEGRLNDDDDDDDEDDASSDGKRSPTPNSVSYSKPKRPDGCKKDEKEKKKRKGDDALKNVMEAIVKARKEANEVRKMARNKDVAAEERRVAAEERKVALEERKVSNEERTRLLEWEKHLFFLDTSNLNEAQKEFVNLSREEVLIRKRAMLRVMGGSGLGAMGGMGGFGAPPDAMDAMGDMRFSSLMGGMGAPSAAMGGMSFNVPPHTHSHEGAVEDLANTAGASRDAVHDEEREEESSSEEAESSSEDEDEDEEED